MDKKQEGLIDNNDGDFILNESGTSVSNGVVEGEIKKNDELDSKTNDDASEISSTGKL